MSLQALQSPSAPALFPAGGTTTFLTDDIAYRRRRAEFKRLAAEELPVLLLDVPAALRVIEAAMPRLASLRTGMARALPRFDATALDKLSACATTLARLEPEDGGSQELRAPALEDRLEAFAFRDALLASVQHLAAVGHVDTRTLWVDGYATHDRIVGNDLVILCRSLLETPPRLRRRCGFSAAQLRRGMALGSRILERVSERDRARARWAAVRTERERVFKALYFTYQDVRAAVHVVRAHWGDANAIAPSLLPPPSNVPSTARDDGALGALVRMPVPSNCAFQRAS